MRGAASPTERAGHFDLLVTLAHEYHWTPDQVFEMDPDFIDELLMRREAEIEHAEEVEKKAARERKRKRGRR